MGTVPNWRAEEPFATIDFKGRTAVVTGGANGVGIGLVRALPREGANVAIATISSARSAASTISRRWACASMSRDAGYDERIGIEAMRRESYQAARAAARGPI